MIGYQKMIAEDAAKMRVDVDPRHVEAWMRLEYGVLDHLPRRVFADNIQLTIEIEKEAPGESELLAQSFNL